jgi:DNA-binding NarL/FixJ family response regulator
MVTRDLPSQRQAPIRVLVVDDHRTFTDLVCLALNDQPDLDCVATAHDSAEARLQVARHRPQIVLMDVDLGTEDGLDLTAELVREDPELLVVVLTAHGNARVMRRAAAAGACALLPKDGSLPDLLHGLRNARHGELFVHPGLLRTLVVEQEPQRRGGAPRPELTPRESRVLQLLAEGRSVNDIAGELKISVHTTRGYVKTLLSKLGAHSQLEAVVVAGIHGLVDAPRRG